MTTYDDNAPPAPEQGMSGQRRSVDAAALGTRLLDEYKAAETARSLYSERWLKDLMAYKGFYDSSVAARLKASRKSSVYYRMTTAKVNTMTARLMDLLFPQRTKNWSISPTPDPDLPPDILKQELGPEMQAQAQGILQEQLAQLQQQNVIPDDLALKRLSNDAEQQAFRLLNTPANRQRVAQARAARMEAVIDDQLKECNANGQRRPSWQQNCRSAVTSACLYGMGVIKGPLVERVTQRRYAATQDENSAIIWQEQAAGESLRPYHEAVSIWDLFPDPDARAPEELRHIWQLHLYADKDLLDLTSFPGFDGAAIRRYMQAHPDGDARLETWEAQLRELDPERSGGDSLLHRYRVLERWGFLSGADLAGAGADIPHDREADVYPANIWMLMDGTIIKAAVNPLEGVDIPYFFFAYQQDDATFWPEGIASLLRAPQAGVNAAVRAMQDNAAASSGPVLGINVHALSQGEELGGMLANRIFLFDKPGAHIGDLFSAVSVPSCIEQNLALFNFWQNAADEVSTPRFNAGDGNTAGAGKTASGLSMLMGASNILLKDHVKNFDDCIIAPFIRAMFRWNMRWNPRADIKGDFEVVASGSQSLIAKEVRAQQVPALITYLGIPAFEKYIKPDELLEVALEQTDLPVERILRTEEEARTHEAQTQAAAARAQAQAFVQELEARGMPPEQVQQQLLLMAAQHGMAAQAVQ